MTQALNFETINLHLDKFDFTINSKKNEIISGGDDLVVKFYDLNSKFIKERIDINEEIKAISFGCGKLVFGQSNSLQMVDLEINSKFSEEATILLTTFNSQVRKIIFNEKLNLLISFSEDDDLQIVNLKTLDVFKYKSNHDGSLKSMAASPNGDFLITTGCDGYLSVYEFLKNDDLGKIIAKKKISISQKLSLENPQILDVDINTSNQCVVGGNLILRTITLSNSISIDSLNVVHENSISHKDDINYVRWINNHFMVTCDIKNLFKIWNFSNKTVISQLDASHITSINNDNYISRLEFHKTGNETCHLIFKEKYGNINISDKINYSIKQSENHNSNKFKDVKYKLKTNEDIEVDRKIENMISDLDFEEDSKKIDRAATNAEENNNNMKSEDILNLSDVEDENGEIKNQDDIQKAREEKNKDEERAESFADDIIGCLPQQIFSSTSTSLQNNSNARYICWNMIGQIIQRQEVNFKAIDIIFSDISNKKKITYIDVNDISLAVMNNCGAFLANQFNEEDEYDYKKNSVLQFKSIHTNINSVFKDWFINLPPNESSLCLAIGTDWCAAFTNLFYLRVFSLFGNQKIILSLPRIITMAGYENYLAYVYHSSVPLFSCQNLRIKILDSNQLFNEVYDGILPLSPESTLNWFTFSEDGILVSCDSKKIIRGFFLGVCNNWIPLLDLSTIYGTSSNTDFWPIGIQDEEIYGVQLKGNMNEPVVNAKLPIKLHPIQIPFISSVNPTNEDNNITKSSEDRILSSNLIIKHEQFRFENYNTIKQFRDVKSPEFYYSDNLKDEQDLNNKKLDYDKLVLSQMKECTVNGTPERIIDLFNYLMRAKSREMAIKFCQQLDLKNIAQVLISKSELIKSQNSINKEHSFYNKITSGVPRKVYGNNFEVQGENDNIVEKNTKSNQQNEGSNTNTNNIFSFAINVDNFRNVEEEVRNEILRNGDKNQIVNEDNNSLNIKASLNLEKRNSNPFFKTMDSNSKQNYNLYEDLSRSYSGLVNQQNKSQTETQIQANKSSADLSFQNVKQKIGFKRKNNELITTNNSATNDINITHVDKKFKKN